MISTEIVILMAGYINVTILVANTNLLLTYHSISVPTMAFSYIASARIGNKIGEGDIASTKTLINSNFYTHAIVLAVAELIFFLISLTYDMPEMLILQPILMLFMVSSIIISYITSNLIGMGLQKKTVWISLFMNFIIGIPISFYLTFKLGWVYYGPWTGLIIANLANSV